MSATPTTVTITESPRYCLDAIEDAEAIMALNAELLDMWSGHAQWDSTLFTELSTSDFSGVDAYIDHLDSLTTRVYEINDELSYSPFNLNKGLCRDAAAGEN